MTIYAREIEEIVHPKTSSTVETMPKGTRYITLLYHQVRTEFFYGTTMTDSMGTVRVCSHTTSASFDSQGTIRKAGPARGRLAELFGANQSLDLNRHQIGYQNTAYIKGRKQPPR